ncbi:N-acetylglucosamine-6-phosphate deacetylase [Leptodesmis sp.]|uniref:N-acetylglucosamine-6-phosphate deacetylase n=1 Tax=Leptodesmis sp. TaxID=3100501 RepID=UPI0040534F25
MNGWILQNARLIGYEGLQQIAIADGKVTSIQPQVISAVDPASAETKILDIAGDWLSLGGVDLQINGGLGLTFPDLNEQTIDKLAPISKFLWEQGIDAFLPTLVTTSVDNIQRSLATLAEFTMHHAPCTTPIAAMLGVHLEGPFLNPQKRGAHPVEHLQPLTVDNVKRVLGDYASLVRVITLAPELDESGQVIPYLRSLGITVSLGHSMATATQAQQAFDQGARMVTHAFNAMPPLHHREPGLLGAAIVDSRVYCGLIADGQHVSPIMIDILLRAAQYDRGVFLVSDALAPLGLPDGLYPWDTRQIEVTQGTARLLDGTLSGTTLPLLIGVQNLSQWEICPVDTAIALATTAPRQAIELPTTYQQQPAHFLRWHLDAAGQLSWKRLSLNGSR